LMPGVDLADSGEPLQAEHDTSVDRVRTAGKPGPRAPGHHGNRVPGRPPQRAAHLRDRAWPDDGPRPACGNGGRTVTPVTLDDPLISHHGARRKPPPQMRQVAAHGPIPLKVTVPG